MWEETACRQEGVVADVWEPTQQRSHTSTRQTSNWNAAKTPTGAGRVGQPRSMVPTFEIPATPKIPSPKNRGVSKIFPMMLLASAIIFVVTVNPAYGHKLIIHNDTHTDFDSALQIPDHRISWAVYDYLGAGGAKFYTFDAEHGDSFYASIVVPKMAWLGEYSPSLFLVSPAGFDGQPGPFEAWPNTERFAYTGKFPGDEFYEPFGQVTYWERQEIRTRLPAEGKYYIVVADEEGRDGKYALSVGTIEDFSGENVLVVLPLWWLETKLFVDDYFSAGLFFFTLAAVPAVATLAIIRKKSRRSVSKI